MIGQALVRGGAMAMQCRRFATGVRNALLPSCADVIGDTPLVALSRAVAAAGVEGRVLAKLDNLNPGHSKKDRIARQIIEDAEESGALSPGQVVVELTSGNTGTGLAIVCAAKGYPFVAVMSRGNSVERARMMRALGAEVVLVDQLPGSVPGHVSGADLARVFEATDRIVAARGAFRADQFELEGSYRAHFMHTGPEAWVQSGGDIDAFVDFVGSGGTFVGVADFLKRQVAPARELRCFIVEPLGADVLAGRAEADVTGGEHKVQGGGYSMPKLALLERDDRRALVDGYLTVSSKEAAAAARLLARTEGLFAGFSTGANFAAALQVLRSDWGRSKPRTVLMLACDSGLKYLSTDLWPE